MWHRISVATPAAYTVMRAELDGSYTLTIRDHRNRELRRTRADATRVADALRKLADEISPPVAAGDVALHRPA